MCNSFTTLDIQSPRLVNGDKLQCTFLRVRPLIKKMMNRSSLRNKYQNSMIYCFYYIWLMCIALFDACSFNQSIHSFINHSNCFCFSFFRISYCTIILKVIKLSKVSTNFHDFASFYFFHIILDNFYLIIINKINHQVHCRIVYQLKNVLATIVGMYVIIKKMTFYLPRNQYAIILT